MLPKQPAKTQEAEWGDLRHLLAIARTGRLSAAAQRLGVNETTVARRLARVEAALGSRLFDRVEGLLRPTTAGELAIAHAERVELEVEGLQRAVAGRDAEAAGTVRLTSVPILVNRLLAPALPTLAKAHPLLRLELIAEPRDLSLTRRDADIALRVARPAKEQRVLARRVGSLGYAVFAATRKTARPLPWITYDERMAGLPQATWIADQMAREKGRPAAAAVNDAEGLLQLIKTGVGKSLLPAAIGDREPGLVRMSGAEPVLTRELWLLVHPELRQLARIEAVVAWIDTIVRRLGSSV